MDEKTKDKIRERLVICRDIILTLHVDDESNRNAKQLKKDMDVVLIASKQLDEDKLDIELLSKLNAIYFRYKQWKNSYKH